MKKRLLSLLSFALMAVLLAAFIPANAFAEEPTNNIHTQLVYFDKKGNADSKSYTYYTYSGKTTSYKVDDSSIATASYENFKTDKGYGTACTVKFKKAGKVTVTRKFKSNNDGETCESYDAYKTVAYKSPVKTLKIGKTDFSKKVKHSRTFTGKAFKGKVSFKLNKGWKLDRMYKFKISELKQEGDKKQIALKKNKTFKLKKGERLVLMFIKDGKTMSVTYTAK